MYAVALALTKYACSFLISWLVRQSAKWLGSGSNTGGQTPGHPAVTYKHNHTAATAKKAMAVMVE